MKEIKECLLRNFLNPHINKIHLLNEREYSLQELGLPSGPINSISHKLVQVNISKRLSYKDVVQYVNGGGGAPAPLKGYIVFANSDIFFDDSIKNITNTLLHKEKTMYALSRFEYNGEKDLNKCPLFGPRYDSQDTWILHSEQFVRPVHEKAFDFEFGKPGCDNKLVYLMQILGYKVFNDVHFIRTYHNHSSRDRNYSSKDVIGSPYGMIYPSGFNFLQCFEGFNTKGAPLKNLTVLHSTHNFSRMMLKDNDILYSYIESKLATGERFIIPRIAGHENNYAFIGYLLRTQKGSLSPEINNYLQSTFAVMKRNAGIKISNLNSVAKYSLLYLKAFENCDIFGGWEAWGHYIDHIQQSHDFMMSVFSKKETFWAYAFDIFHYIYSRPFTQALRGKRILIVSCFTESIALKVPFRKTIYDGVDLFPDCEFLYIQPPITNGNNPSREFDEELDTFFRRLDVLKDDYDVALLSCGGYGNLVANYIFENHYKSAIYVGGVLQMYFGIYGGRWMEERKDVLRLYMNANWSRPSSVERALVSGCETIENGCYW